MSGSAQSLGIAGRLDRWRWNAGATYAAIVSTTLAGLLFAMLGAGLRWQPFIIAMGAVVVAAATWLSGSIFRGLVCVFGALGIAAAIIATLVVVDAALPATLHIAWAWFIYAWWAVVLALGVAWRIAGAERDFGVAELVGGLGSVAIAAFVAAKLDYAHNLLVYMVQVEDNEAWVSLLTQISHSSYLGPAFEQHVDSRGPIVAMLVGLLGHFQREGIAPYNAAFSVWALAVIFTPLIATGLLRGNRERSPFVLAGFALIAVGWALHIPLLLFASFGHLTATWAFLALLVGVALLACDEVRPWTTPVVGGVLFVVGTAWYPIFPLGLLGLGVAVLWVARSSAGTGRIVGIAVLAVAALMLLLQMVQAAGIGAPDEASSNLTALYSAKGGTAAIDGIVQVLMLCAIAGAAFVPKALMVPSLDRTWRFALAGVAYVGLVFAGAYALKVGIGYGPTKVQFIVGSAIVIAVIASIVRLPLDLRAFVATAIVLAFGSFIYGASGDVLSRSWPGAANEPAWLSAVQSIAGQPGRAADRPVGCFSNDKMAAYFCTRWGAGLTTGNEQPFRDYRIDVANDVDPSAAIDRLIASGALAGSDVIMLDAPDEAHQWAWKLLQGAGAVYGPDGKQIEPKP